MPVLENVNSNIVLRLNAGYQRLGFSSVAQAFSAMMSGNEGDSAYLGLDIQYELNEDGSPDFSKNPNFYPVSWDEWINLPIRSWDLYVRTSKIIIRVPTVVICPNKKDMPLKELRPSPSAIRQRDDNKCVYTGVTLTNKTFSIDHLIPKSRGGKDTWENLAACHKEVNSKKGNKSNKEAGLKLLKIPKAPRAMPLCVLVKDDKHIDHKWF